MEALAQQTEALYGSLAQLHSLMHGPKGAQLRSPTGPSTTTEAGPEGRGFTPAGSSRGSPATSPTGSSGGGPAAAAGAVAPPASGVERLTQRQQQQLRASQAPALEGTEVDEGGGSGPHPHPHRGSDEGGGRLGHLAAKDVLCAEDVAWM